MDPHGVPSAGDFAIARSAAVFLEGTRNVTISHCNFTRVDGNALMVSGHNRGAAVTQNTFSWIGDNAVVVWGRTNETAANPLEGFDGTDGNHPQGTIVDGNVIREIGIYEKQSGWFFQAKAAETVVSNNVMFNAPRNGITFNDPFAGGDLITGNLAFSAMRETQDGGTYNSWDRQPFLTTTLTGQPSPFMKYREISLNFLINNYHMEMGKDLDMRPGRPTNPFANPLRPWRVCSIRTRGCVVTLSRTRHSPGLGRRHELHAGPSQLPRWRGVGHEE